MKDRQAPQEARAALGVELAAYRRAAGCTQAHLARLTEYSRSTIANVETGRQHVPRSFWERADAALRTGGTLATGHDELEAAARRDLGAAARQVSTARQAQAWRDDLNPIPGAPAQPHAGGDAAPARHSREPWKPDEPPVLVDGELPMRLADTPGRQEAEPRRVTPGDVSRLRGMRARLKAIDNAHGGGAALPMATWYLRHEIIPLLYARDGDPVSRALIEVVAEVKHDVAWMAYDAGKQDLATGCFTDALRLARQAGNRLLGGRILAAMSHQAIYLGNKRKAIDFAQAARNL